MRDAVPVKYSCDQRLIEADCFKDLRAAITLERGNSHLRKDFQQSLVDGLVV